MVFLQKSPLGPGVSLALATCALIGCGGSSSLSDQQLVAKADAICTKLRASAPTPPTSGGDFGALSRYADQAYGPAQQALQGVRALKPSSTKSPAYGRFVDAGPRRAAAVQSLSRAAPAPTAPRL